MELSQNQKLGFAFSLLAAAGGLVSVLVYLQNQKTKKVSDEIVFLDKQIKSLDLAYKKQRNANADLPT